MGSVGAMAVGGMAVSRGFVNQVRRAEEWDENERISTWVSRKEKASFPQ